MYQGFSERVKNPNDILRINNDVYKNEDDNPTELDYLTEKCSIYKENLDPKSIKFTNGVVIKFSIDNAGVNINYKSKNAIKDQKNFKSHESGCYQYIPGEIDLMDKYLHKERNEGFKTYEHSISPEIKQSLKSIIRQLNLDSVNIYIIRHLKADHNDKVKWSNPLYKYNDTYILPDKIKKAVENNIDMLPDEKPRYNFVSDLRRTRETLCEFYRKRYGYKIGDDRNCKIDLFDQKPIVLPNIHEIDSDCTESTKQENILKNYNKKNNNKRGDIDHTLHPTLQYFVDVDVEYYEDNDGNVINNNNKYNIVYEVLLYLIKKHNLDDKDKNRNLDIFVVTHSSTIACFLKKIIQDDKEYIRDYDKLDKKYNELRKKSLKNLLLRKESLNNLFRKRIYPNNSIYINDGGKLKRRTRKQRNRTRKQRKRTITRKQRKLQSKRRKNNKSKKSVKKRKNLNKNKRSKIRKSKY